MKPITKLIILAIALVSTIFLFENNALRNKILAQARSLNYLSASKFKNKFHLPLTDEIDATLDASQASGVPSPIPDIPGGCYERPVTVQLIAVRPDAILYYTLDNSTPTTDSPVYRESLRIARTTVLRFREYHSDGILGKTVTHTYIINQNIHLPIVSLVTEPVNLWNKNSGIYVHPHERGPKWERAANIEYFDEAQQRKLSVTGALRIHGNWTRKAWKKSFRFRFHPDNRNDARIPDVLNETGFSGERTIILRAAGGRITAMLRDELFNSLYLKSGGTASQSSPALLLLNGKIWGIYYLRERIDEDFLERRFGQGDYDLLYKRRDAILGEAKNWKKFRRVFKKHSLATAEYYQKFTEQLDVDDFLRYWLYNIYAANLDWPHYNVYVYRKKESPDSLWRWIAWDTDATFLRKQGIIHNTLAWAARKTLRHDLKWDFKKGYRDQARNLKYSQILWRALENEGFRQQFVTRFCDYLNDGLSPKNAMPVFEKIVRTLQPDLHFELQKRRVDSSYLAIRVEGIRNFIRKRPEIIRNYFREELHLGETYTIELRVQPKVGGRIQINSILAEDFPWQGKYFSDFPVTLTAKPLPGYQFIRWTDRSLPPSPQVTLRLDRDRKIGAVFEKVP